MQHKVTTLGVTAQVTPFPPKDTFAAAPAEAHEAHAALKEANDAAVGADRARVEAIKAARSESTPSKRLDLEDEVERLEREVKRLKAEARSAARTLAGLLDEAYPTMIAGGARRAVEQHVERCDAFAALAAVAGSATWTPLRQPGDLADYVDPATQTRATPGDFGAYLDETNVAALLERAGMTAAEAGLVLAVKKGAPYVRFFTTPARAALLPNEYEIEEVV